MTTPQLGMLTALFLGLAIPAAPALGLSGDYRRYAVALLAGTLVLYLAAVAGYLYGISLPELASLSGIVLGLIALSGGVLLSLILCGGSAVAAARRGQWSWVSGIGIFGLTPLLLLICLPLISSTSVGLPFIVGSLFCALFVLPLAPLLVCGVYAFNGYWRELPTPAV